MFSFHKPKIYRSNLGCCICKAKSSSSRFTDSKKYENEFELCFRIQEKRSGEICNACVLLVKRWKKLSPENRLTKHWHHVVDARAGPGTKLTGGRRLTSGANHQQVRHLDTDQQGPMRSERRASGAKTEPGQHALPLSSSNQANGAQASSLGSSGCSSGASGAFSAGPTPSKRFNVSKARAIDTNVSTFTFGEPARRSYGVASTSASFHNYSSCVGQSLAGPSFPGKPQSSLNSSAFESVIKRFRQRQQQQQVEEKRRLEKRHQRQLQPLSGKKIGSNSLVDTQEDAGIESVPSLKVHHSSNLNDSLEVPVSRMGQSGPSKRLKRSSENLGSISIDGVRVSSLLDSSIWRREKVCCGVIFRGLYNEVAVFPKLLKPCQCRAGKSSEQAVASPSSQPAVDDQIGSSLDRGLNSAEDILKPIRASSLAGNLEPPPPPPRTTKSGSISSCDSHTSGTGSMEQPLDEEELKAGEGGLARQSARAAVADKRRRDRQQQVQSASSSQSLGFSSQADNSSGQFKDGLKQQETATGKRRRAGKPKASDAVASSAWQSSCPEMDSMMSNSSGSSGSASARSSRKLANKQPLRSPASSSTSGASSSRALLIGEEEGDDDDDDDDDDDEMEIVEDRDDVDVQLEDDEDEDDEEEMDDDDDDDASSSVESLAQVERKKSTVDAMG